MQTPILQYAFLAPAMDEKRSRFKPCLWQSRESDEETQVNQCWFLGSHGDVGGNEDASLGAVTLLWMIGLLHDRVGVAFSEDEIGKHLRHKILEWDFNVGQIFWDPSRKEAFGYHANIRYKHSPVILY